MAGNTSTISVQAFSADWAAHLPMRALCERYTITRDQVVRLAVVWELPRRHDRALRWKPKRSEQRDPTEDEIWNKLVFQIQATWDESTELQRRVTKPTVFELRPMRLPDDCKNFVDDANRWEQS